MTQSTIEINGADANNLKNIDVIFPLNAISVVTGVSGSGKSSLLAATLAAEGSRRTDTFLGIAQREVGHDDIRAFISQTPPTILIGQRGFRPNIRTTAGTATGFLSVLRRLFVLESKPYSESAQAEVPQPSPESYTDWLSNHYRGRAEIWAAPLRNQRSDGIAAAKRLAAAGVDQITVYSETDPPRMRETGRSADASRFRGLNPSVRHSMEGLVGSIEISAGSRREVLRGLLDLAFVASNGSVVVMLEASADPHLSSQFGARLDSTKHWVHPNATEVFTGATPHILSFNAPEHEDSGACPTCHGTGVERRLDEAALIQHPDRSMSDGAFAIWTPKNYRYINVQHETIRGLNGIHGFTSDVPWSLLPPSARELILGGSDGELVVDQDAAGRPLGGGRPFQGFRKLILAKAGAGTRIAARLSAFVEAGPCEACNGTRWSSQARALRVGGHNVVAILSAPFSEVEPLTDSKGDIAQSVSKNGRILVAALNRHARSIVSAGLGHLSGDRGMLAVSEGESRRIRLARVLDADEAGMCFLLDEPARGLHESDLGHLAAALERLRGKHTVILNEHRERLWGIADWFIEIGPGGGDSGGEIALASSRGPRGTNHSEVLRSALPITRPQSGLRIRGATIHNVENVDCDIPLGRLTCISGPSGSGKSSFVHGILAPALLERVAGGAPVFQSDLGRWRSFDGADAISEVIVLGQAMPPANRRSLVATTIGVFDGIRRLFGATPAAKAGGLAASDFGINAGNGRCPVCLGIGEVAADDLWSACPACGGARYGQPALAIRVAGMNVQELLDTPLDRLLAHTDEFQMSERLIMAMCDLGIGYLNLGRRLDTLSGGEVQRLRLGMRLGSQSSGSLLFILDEPAAGLHPRDVPRLATALDRVLAGGKNTLVVVEHNLSLIRSADYVLEFGPGGGPEGGKIVFAGSPEELMKTETLTGRALAGTLPTPKKRSRERASTRSGQPLGVDDRVSRTAALMRTLITGDATLSTASDEGIAEPIVPVAEHFWSGRDSWEVAGLDREIPKLLLDVQRPSITDALDELVAVWREHPASWLAIQPFITAMQVWGAQLPKSVIRDVVAHLGREGLRLETTRGETVGSSVDVRTVRATGSRFKPEGASDLTRTLAVRDALAVGAGYVELHGHGGEILAVVSKRLLDLQSATVAPMAPVPSHFSRLDPRGRCMMCSGARTVATIPHGLIIADDRTSPDSTEFLAPQANAVMKGVYQGHLRPFLRRLAAEGLWDAKASFTGLDAASRELLLFGYWARPGHGSFLKSARANPGEVASWLRWDGLYRHLLEQVGRSRDASWVKRVRDESRSVRCPRCGGSGLEPFAELLWVGDMTFPDWIRRSDPALMLRQLRQVKPLTLRQRRTHERILHCLEPLADQASGITPAAVVKRAIESFTTMPAAILTPTDGG